MGEELLRLAAREAEQRIVEELINETINLPEHRFSKHYENQKNKIIKQANQKYLISKRELQSENYEITFTSYSSLKKFVKIAIVAVVILIITMATAIGLYIENDNSWDFIFHPAGDMSEVEIKDDDSTPGFLVGTYTYIPEGYTLVSDEVHKNRQDLLYRNNDGSSIICDSSKNSTGVTYWDTENTVVEEVMIGFTKGAYFEDDLTDTKTISWVTGKYHHTITAYEISKEELIKMASSRIKK